MLHGVCGATWLAAATCGLAAASRLGARPDLAAGSLRLAVLARAIPAASPQGLPWLGSFDAAARAAHHSASDHRYIDEARVG